MKKKEEVYKQQRSTQYFQNLDTQLMNTQSSLRQLSRRVSISLSEKDEEEIKDLTCDAVYASSDGPTDTNNTGCVVCFENEPSHAFIPCGHLILCTPCSTKFDADIKGKKNVVKCPLCREPTICVTKIFR